MKSAVAILSATCFLTVGFGAVSRAVAADAFETWPKKTTEPGVVEKKPETDANGAGKAGGEAGKNVEKGTSTGTVGWIALGAAAVIGIAVAAGGGGGGTTSNH